MNKIVLFSLSTALLLLSGCASLPSPSAMQEDIKGYQLPMAPKDDKAIVYVVRPSALGGIVRFNAFLDNKEDASEMGYTRSGQYIYFFVSAGPHQILSKAENWAELNVDAKPGDVIFIQQEPSMGIIMARNNLFIVPDYTGKYHVKHLSLGTIKKVEQ